MRIAIVCPASLPATQFGGILFLGVDIANELSKRNNEVTIYTTDLDFANNAKTFNKKLPRIEIIDNFTVNRSHVWFRIGLFFVNPTMYFQMMKYSHEVIHTIGIRSFQSLIAAIVAKKKKIPLVISDQGGLTTHPDLTSNSPSRRILYKLQFPLIKFIINRATRIVVANEYEQKIFQQFCDESKIVIVQNGINLEKIKQSNFSFKEKYKISSPFILFIGRFNKIKGIDVLLRAISVIKNDNNVGNILFVIMGVDFGFEKEMTAMISKLELKNRIMVIKKPPREDVIAAYQECEFLVLPSRWELSPLTPLEGFAFKKTVISTKAHGIPYTLTNEKNSILVEPDDHVSLATAIIQLIIDVEKRKSLGLAGFELVKNKLNSESMALNIMKVYQQIVKE